MLFVAIQASRVYSLKPETSSWREQRPLDQQPLDEALPSLGAQVATGTACL
jgi:hypothetical protein